MIYYSVYAKRERREGYVVFAQFCDRVLNIHRRAFDRGVLRDGRGILSLCSEGIGGDLTPVHPKKRRGIVPVITPLYESGSAAIMTA